MGKRKLFIIAGVAAFLLIGNAVYWYSSRDINTYNSQANTNDGTNQNGSTATDLPINPNDEISESNKDEVIGERPAENEPAKTPQTTTVDKQPLIYTGYGHNALKPLPSGQSTSTTCTTDAGVSCTVKATNQTTQQVVDLGAITTDSEGVAKWNWIGGETLSSGTWELVAVAGDKTSEKEIIYVQ